MNFLKKKKGLSHEDLQGLKDLGDLGEMIRKLPSQQFSNLCSGYTKAINKAFDRRGSLFQPNLKRKAVEGNEYLLTLVRYIHLNPVIHDFVESPEQWVYSSLKAYTSDLPTNIHRETIFRWFGGKKSFQQYHKSLLAKEIKKINEYTFE
ncbi:MAG: hypothetical protein FH748_07055 [Balneolaceae bacterium]|nr:hypothetical protein [Balneolaceae bacterium]